MGGRETIGNYREEWGMGGKGRGKGRSRDSRVGTRGEGEEGNKEGTKRGRDNLNCSLVTGLRE